MDSADKVLVGTEKDYSKDLVGIIRREVFAFHAGLCFFVLHRNPSTLASLLLILFIITTLVYEIIVINPV